MFYNLLWLLDVELQLQIFSFTRNNFVQESYSDYWCRMTQTKVFERPTETTLTTLKENVCSHFVQNPSNKVKSLCSLHEKKKITNEQELCCEGSLPTSFQKWWETSFLSNLCQCWCLVFFANHNRLWSTTQTLCPGSLQTLPCAKAPYGMRAAANFPPSAHALYLNTEALCWITTTLHPIGAETFEMVNFHPAGGKGRLTLTVLTYCISWVIWQ